MKDATGMDNVDFASAKAQGAHKKFVPNQYMREKLLCSLNYSSE
jgi:hypothetical protein